MLPGPVFNVELITTARRARYYAIRFVYGICLLFFIVETVSQWGSGTPDAVWRGHELSISQMAEMGRTIFVTFSVVQGVTLLLLTPTLVAGVIADERQRKTLSYLMASRLSSVEIILGKLCARLLHVAIFLAIGLPVMSLLSLFGGVDPRVVLLVYLATGTTVFFLASLSILISTFARRPREANTQAYLLGMFWLFVPTLLDWFVPRWGGNWAEVYAWFAPIMDPIRWSSPFSLLQPAGWVNLADNYAWMVGLQLGASLLFVLLAIIALRPVARREGGGAGRWKSLGRAGWLRRYFPRPEIGEDAMLWKERHVSRSSGVARIAMAILFAIVLAALGYTTYLFGAPAAVELWHHGYGSGSWSEYHERFSFSVYLRVTCTLLYAVWCLAAASLASSSVSGEREEDTWISLTATPLSGDDILRAKIVGAVWGTRWFGFLLLALWLTGLFTGAVHPLGVIAVVIESAVFLWFVAALGVGLSLGSKTSARAQAVTMLCLIGLNGGYLFCCLPLQPETILVALGVTPMIEALSLMNYQDIESFYHVNTPRLAEAVLTCLLGTVLYGGAALALTTSACSSFDRLIDRPMRNAEAAPFTGKELKFLDDEEPS